jgi:hypothetical protein
MVQQHVQKQFSKERKKDKKKEIPAPPQLHVAREEPDEVAAHKVQLEQKMQQMHGQHVSTPHVLTVASIYVWCTWRCLYGGVCRFVITFPQVRQASVQSLLAGVALAKGCSSATDAL